MPIDNYAEAIALSKKLESAVPFKVQPGKELLKLLRKNGKHISPDDELEVALVSYSGDMGGIMCTLAKREGDEEGFVTSLTHLKFDPTHPLAEEVKAYQQKRVHALKLQNSRGFMAEMSRLSASSEQKKKRSNRGFGK